MTIAPAARNLVTISASLVAISFIDADPHRNGSPSTSMISLTSTGTPASAPRLTCRAASRAPSGSRCTTAFSAAVSSARRSACSTRSSGSTSPARTAAAIVSRDITRPSDHPNRGTAPRSTATAQDSAWTSLPPNRTERKAKQWCHGSLLPSGTMIDGVDIKSAAPTDAEVLALTTAQQAELAAGYGQDQPLVDLHPAIEFIVLRGGRRRGRLRRPATDQPRPWRDQ